MGGSGSKITPLPVPIILKRINDCVIPDDKGAILDFVEMIDIQLSNPKTNAVALNDLKAENGILMLLKLMKKMIDDAELISVCVQVFECIKFNTPLVMDFIQYGGLDLLEKGMRSHSEDDFLAMAIPKLLNVLLALGASVSMQELKNEGLSLQICQKCQETIERSKNTNYFMAQVKIPRSCDRVNRVLKFMDNYLARVDVQVVALDAVINFVRNPDAKSQARDTNIIPVVGRSISAHPNSKEIIWRACMALSILVTFHGEIANDVAMLGIHDVLIDSFASFNSAPAIQQQVLWLLSSFMMWPKSQRILHRSAKCMEFFKRIVVELAPTGEGDSEQPVQGAKPSVVVTTARKSSLASTQPMASDPKGVKRKPSATPADKGRKASKAAVAPASKADKKGSSKGDEKKAGSDKDKEGGAAVAEPEPEYERKEFEVVVPLLIKTFLRQTGGLALNEKPPPKEKKEFRARRNFDEKPKFGTVEDAIFVPGKEGLIATGPEDDDGENKREIPDWEKRLNYGELSDNIGMKKKPKA